MERYANWGGNSGVYGYQIGLDSIIVYFKDGSAYLYTYSSTGRGSVEQMKQLAEAGQGLNSLISTEIRKNYASKLR